MPNGLSRSFFNLFLDRSCRARVIHENAELVALDEEATGLLCAVGVEVHRFYSEIADMTSNDYPNDAEQAAGDLVHVLGVLLHETERKHPTRPRKTSKTLAKLRLHLSERRHA